MNLQKRKIIETLQNIYIYHGISPKHTDPEDTTVISYVERLIKEVGELK